MKILSGFWAFVFAIFLAESAPAVPLMGGFEVVGNFMPVPGPLQPGGGVFLNGTTAIDFTACNGVSCIPASGQNPSPGVAGEFKVVSGSGTFLGFVDHVGSIKDFTFSGPGNVNFPNVPVAVFELVGLLTFDLSSIAIITQNPALLELAGTGVFHLPGFDDTAGNWSFTGQQTCNAGLCPPGFSETFVFNAPNSIPSVPEPSTLLLVGIGLIGLSAWGRARARRAQ